MARRLWFKVGAHHGDRISPKRGVEIFDDFLGCSVMAEIFATDDEQIAPLDPLPCPITVAWSEKDVIVPVSDYGPNAGQRLPQALKRSHLCERARKKRRKGAVMDLGLAGKTAVVTGASRGIGLAIVRALAAGGAHVVAGSQRSSGELDELTRGGRPSVSGTPSDPQRQLGLFHSPPPDEALRTRLAALDVDHMTPIEALTLLAELKNSL